ncbi:MAG: hypothetical protein H6628_21325, partial [Calditrichae bacterium]|nr:hypothetical protein [Calditrichia bacterium]
MSQAIVRQEFDFLKRASAEKRVKSQQQAVELLLEKYRNGNPRAQALENDPIYQ